MKIKLNKNQAFILQHALDMYCRIGTKQLEMIISEMDDDYFVLNPKVEEEVKRIKKKLFNMDLHEGKGIAQTKQPFKEAYSMMKILQKYLNDKYLKSFISVWKDGNLLQLNKYPDIKLEE